MKQHKTNPGYQAGLNCMLLGMALALLVMPRLVIASAGPNPGTSATEPATRINPSSTNPDEEEVKASPHGSLADPVVRVNVTFQSYNFVRPWAKNQPGGRSGVGAVLDGAQVLVTAELVADASFIEIELPETGDKTPARLVVADHSANLALVEPVAEDFLKEVGTFKLAPPSQIGDMHEAWQIEDNGSVLRTEALLTAAQVRPYPKDDIALLLYQLTSALQSRNGSFNLPLVRDGLLAGVIMRYDARSQNMSAIPVEVIEHFLKDLADAPYDGFPRVGISYTDTRDPQLRKYVGLDPKNGGAYITFVKPGSPAAEAGIRVGDVLLEVAGRRIDRDGNYDDPQYGRIALTNVITLFVQSGEQVTFKVLSAGEQREVEVTARAESPGASVSPPYVIGQAPDYIIVGGLVFQELSRQYLMEWGANWPERANPKLIYYDRFQNDLFPEGGRRIVFLSQVLPTPATLGYQDVGQLVVTRVNDQVIHSLQDLDAALQSPLGGFHKFEFEDAPRILFLEAGEADKTNEALQRIYGLPEVRRLGFSSPVDHAE